MARDMLNQIGLTPTEISVYLNILEYGKTTPARISRQTSIKRTTVYAAVQELVKMGIVAEDNTGKIKHFVSLPPTALRDYLTQRERNLADQIKIVEQVIPELELLPKSKTYSIPKVRVIEDGDIIDFLYKQTPVWIQSMIDTKQTTHWGFQDHSFVENKAYQEWIDWYWQHSKNTDLKLLTNDAKVEKQTMKKKSYGKRQVKFWQGKKFTASQWVMGEYVIHVVTDTKRHYLVQTRDRLLADNLRVLFQHFWKTVK